MSKEVKTLGEVADFINGLAFKPSDWEQEGKRIIRIQNLTNPDKPFNKTSRRVDPKYIVRKGDLLVSWSASLGVFEWNNSDDAVLNQHIFKVVPKIEMDKSYLRHSLRQAVNIMDRYTHGSTMKHINREEFLATQIPWRKIGEQRRIATILDKADAIRRKRRQAIDLMNDFLRSVFLEMFGDPISNLKEFPEKELQELLLRIDSGKSPVCLSRPANSDEWGILKLSSVTGCSFRENENKAITDEHKPCLDHEVKQGDLLFTRKNTYELVGDCAYVWCTRPRLLLPDLIFRLVLNPDTKIHALFLWGLLSTPSMREQLKKLAGGTAGSMPNISKSRLERLRIPLAPIELQEKYARIAQRINNLKSQLENGVSLSNELFNALSGKWMSGDADSDMRQ